MSAVKSPTYPRNLFRLTRRYELKLILVQTGPRYHLKLIMHLVQALQWHCSIFQLSLRPFLQQCDGKVDCGALESRAKSKLFWRQFQPFFTLACLRNWSADLWGPIVFASPIGKNETVSQRHGRWGRFAWAVATLCLLPACGLLSSASRMNWLPQSDYSRSRRDRQLFLRLSRLGVVACLC